MKEIMRKLLLSVGGVLCCVLILELALQSFAVVYATKKNSRNNSAVVGGQMYKILCLGDSMTDCQYPWQLEKVLNIRTKGKHFKVIDKGKSGTKSDFILSTLNTYLNEYMPDMVVVMMGRNDGRDELVVTEINPDQWYRRLRLYKLIKVLHVQVSSAIKERKFIEVEGVIRKAIEMNPRNGHTYMALGKLYSENKQYYEAENMFRVATEENIPKDMANLQLGITYCEEGKYSEAGEILRKALALNPKNVQTYVHLGRTYRYEKKYREAEVILKKAINLNQRNARAYAELCMVYQCERRNAEAEAMFIKAIEINPRTDEIYVQQANAYWEQKRYREAEELYRKAVEVDPSQPYRGKDKEMRSRYLLSLPQPAGGKNSIAESNIQGNNTKKIELVVQDKSMPFEFSGAETKKLYARLKKIVFRRGVKLVCVQYPRCPVKPLMDMLEPNGGIIFVDNMKTFDEGVAREGYDAYFIDRFAGNFGHCTYKGNQLLAENIADAIVLSNGQSK